MDKRNIKSDLQKLSVEYFKNMVVEDDYIGADQKRPFGNSAIESDILEIIGQQAGEDGNYSDEQYDYANDLYYKYLIPYIQKSNIPDYRAWIKAKRKQAAFEESPENELEAEEIVQVPVSNEKGFFDRLIIWLDTPIKLFN